MSYTASANYLARDSKESRWLIRPSNSDKISSLSTASFLTLIDVKFESSDFEVGFGCSIVAKARSYGHSEYLNEQCKPLKFDTNRFVDAETNETIEECERLVLRKDGSMYYVPKPKVCETYNRPL